MEGLASCVARPTTSQRSTNTGSLTDTFSNEEMYRVRGRVCVQLAGGDVGTFGQILRQHRQGRRLSLRDLSGLTQFGFTFLSPVERGERKATEKLAYRCDAALEANGALIEAQREDQTGEVDMHRRTVLRAMGALAASPLPSVQWEALRHGMAVAANSSPDQWDQIIYDYGVAYYRTSADEMMNSLRADLTVLQALIAVEVEESERHRLLRAAGHLSVIVALSAVAAGNLLAGRRWWRDAHQYASDSGDPKTIVLTRAWEVVNGCYDGRAPSRAVSLSDDVLPLVANKPNAASCGLLAGRAQALSLAGRHRDAITTLSHLTNLVGQLPTSVIDDVDSLWGWPEHRLRHTEAWVYAHAGMLDDADRAQQQAIALYPSNMARLRTQVQLHHAAALIRTGMIPEGLRLAADLLEQLPAAQHNQLVHAVARQVIDAVPTEERRRPVFRELTDYVTA